MKDLTGQKFGRLTVIKRNGTLSNGSTRISAWLCACFCGNEITTRERCLKTGNTKSCGCLRDESRKLRATHGKSKHHLYKLWADIKKRCSGKGSARHDRFYYDKGIRVCKQWQKFEPFYSWAKTRWIAGLEVDRIDTLKGYSPDNCRFVTRKINQQNSRRGKFWVVYGKQFGSSRDAAKFFGVAQSHIYFLCHGRKLNGKVYYPEPFCYAVKKYATSD